MRSYGGGSENAPSPKQIRAWVRRVQPPENEVPVVLPVAEVLGRTGEVAVVLTGVRVHTTGVALDVAVRLRTEPHGRSDVFELISGHHGGGDVDVDRLLLLGIELADGRTATTLNPSRWPGPGPGPGPGRSEAADDADDAPLLSPSSGGGGGRSYEQHYFLHPVPPSGPFTVVCSWPAFGILEARTVLDGTVLADAAARVHVLWPDEPPSPGPDELPEPPTPSSGWFADAIRRRRRP